jgi:CubicO group peptidase (beta-lactamase class C family)
MTTTTTTPAAAVHDPKEFLANLPEVLEKARADNGIPGMSVAILYKGELVFAQGFGKRNRNDPFTEEV